ncbi:MAG: IS256 family transposase [Lachnospiraceae bacterium]|nr:IS256 family transposase [Lachnospiraceae bacterium]
MAQLNITLNQEEILQLLSKDHDQAFRELLKSSLNSILMAESTAQLKAEPYERSEERTDSRNGTRERELKTRIGRITLTVPRHRNVPFKTLVFENYSRSEAALIASMAEMVVSGVATRKVSNIMETLCGTTFSKSSVSDVCKDLDEKVEEFRNRPLSGSYPFLTVDATYFKVRVNHRIISRAFMIAYGTNQNGHREILGFGVFDNESKSTWNAFLQSLKDRGLKDLLMITSDAHEGIQDAISKVFPDVPWQRCQFHFSKNISEKAPKKYQAGIRAELQEMWNCETIDAARKRRDAIIADYKDVAESAMMCLDEGFESAMTVMTLPKYLRKYFRTSNHIERLNKELKRRSSVIGIFPNESSLLRLMGSVLLERNDVLNARKAIFSPETYAALINSSTVTDLRQLATEQQKLRAA